jgi:hypothetical protein
VSGGIHSQEGFIRRGTTTEIVEQYIEPWNHNAKSIEGVVPYYNCCFRSGITMEKQR